MIISKHGIVTLKGNKREMLADLAVVIRALEDSGMPREEIDEAVVAGHKSVEELMGEIKESINKFVEWYEKQKAEVAENE